MAEARQEYRIVWQRAGGLRKTKRYATKAGADRFLLLFGPEPWRAWGKEPEARFCCTGWECACEGETHREHAEAQREQLPKLDYIRVESRPVGQWTEL